MTTSADEELDQLDLSEVVPLEVLDAIYYECEGIEDPFKKLEVAKRAFAYIGSNEST